MDSWIYPCIQVSMDTWIVGYLKWFSIRILGYLSSLDSWIIGYSTFLVSGYLASQKCLDIHVSGYPTIRIPHLYLCSSQKSDWGDCPLYTASSSDGPVTSSPTKIEFLFQGSDLNALSTHVFSIGDIVWNWKIQNTSPCVILPPDIFLCAK